MFPLFKNKSYLLIGKYINCKLKICCKGKFNNPCQVNKYLDWSKAELFSNMALLFYIKRYIGQYSNNIKKEKKKKGKCKPFIFIILFL